MEAATGQPTCAGLHRLVDLRFVVALAALIVNDHWAKATFDNIITGKVSDVAGMIVLPLLLIACAESVLTLTTSGRHRTLIEQRHIRGAALVLSGVLLTAIKVSSGAADAVASTLTWLTGTPQSIVADPTDLIGLAALFFANHIALRPRPFAVRRLAKPVRVLALGVGLLACVATSFDEDSGWTSLDVEPNGDVVASGDIYNEWEREPIVSSDTGRTWSPHRNQRSDEDVEADERPAIDVGPTCLERQPAICVRTTRERNDGVVSSTIEESTDGGTTWSRVWVIEDTTAFWITEAYGYNASIHFGDIAVLDDDTVLVAAAHVEPIRRDSATGSWSPTPADVQKLPAQWLIILSLTTVPLVGAVRRARGRALDSLIWVAAAAGVFFCGAIAAGDSVGPGIVVGGVIVLGLFVLLAVIGLVGAERGRRRPNSDYALRWSSAVVAMAAVAVPMALFDAALLSWATANTMSFVVVGAGSLAAGFVGEPPTSLVGARAAAQPPPPAIGAQPAMTPSAQPPPPSASSAPQQSRFPSAMLLLTPVVAVPPALLIGGVIASTIGFGDDLGGVVSIASPVILLVIATAWWSNRVITNSGVTVPFLRTRATVSGILSAVGPIGLAFLGSYQAAVAVAFLTPYVVLRLGARDAEADSAPPPHDSSPPTAPPSVPTMPVPSAGLVRPPSTPPRPPQPRLD